MKVTLIGRGGEAILNRNRRAFKDRSQALVGGWGPSGQKKARAPAKFAGALAVLPPVGSGYLFFLPFGAGAAGASSRMTISLTCIFFSGSSSSLFLTSLSSLAALA